MGVSSSSSFLPTPATLRPLEAAISLRVVLSLQALYSFTLLSEKTSIIQLLSSVVGLTGIFGAFGLAYRGFRALTAVQRAARTCSDCAAGRGRQLRSRSRRRGGSSKLLAMPAVVGADSTPAAALTLNPLQAAAAAVSGQELKTVLPPAANPWRHHQDDDGTVYYVNLQTGESVWTLPPGEMPADSGT